MRKKIRSKKKSEREKKERKEEKRIDVYSDWKFKKMNGKMERRKQGRNENDKEDELFERRNKRK